MGKSLEIQVVPKDIMAEVRQLAPVAAFQRWKYWQRLDPKEQSVVVDEGQQLAAAMIMGGMSDLAKGQHLMKLHDILQPKGYFLKFLKQYTKYGFKQAYRYINGYKNAAERLSPPVLRAAMQRNMRIFGDDAKRPLGIFTDAVRQLEGKTTGKLGPGPTADPKRVEKWLDQVEKTTKERKSHLRKAKLRIVDAEDDPDELQKEAFRFITSRYKRLPNNSRTRITWLEDLFGMVLGDAGVGSPKSISPSAPPEEFRPKPVGRPTKREPEADAAAAG